MINFIRELKTFLASWRSELRAKRDFRNLVDADAADAIADDIASEAEARRQIAFKARVADDEGLALLERVAKDGTVTPAEMPDVLKSIRHIRRSRELDHSLSEAESRFRAPALF